MTLRLALRMLCVAGAALAEDGPDIEYRDGLPAGPQAALAAGMAEIR